MKTAAWAIAVAILLILILIGLGTAFPGAFNQSTVTVRSHDLGMTEKSELDVYPPEAAGYPSTLMRTKEFKRKFQITKDKKSHGFENPGEFFRLHQMIRTRGGKAAPEYPANYRLIELEKARRNAGSRQQLGWVERGPGNVSGRTRAIVVDPADADYNTWLAGAVSGGIWKTTDAGQSWVHKTADLPNLSISWMVMAPSNEDVLYAGTGEGFYNLDGVRGDGILKSTDRGETWAQLPNTIQFSAVNRVIVDPNDENTVLAAVQANLYDAANEPFSGIQKSTDGGGSWYSVYDEPNDNRVQDIVADPTDFSIQYASVNSMGLVKSTDEGETWVQNLDVSSSGGGRLELAIAPSDPQVVYATLDITGVASHLYQSTDAGSTWVDLATQGIAWPNWLGFQGWYDNTIAVSPYDSSDVYVGGINMWRKHEVTEGIIDVQENGTEAFLDLFPWGGYEGGGVGTGYQFAQAVGAPVVPFGLVHDDWTSVEVRFGPGRSQQAHWFAWNANPQNPPGYEDYVTVPFEVWDTTNDRQIMASFFDHDNDGEFNLLELLDPANPPNTFVFVHSIDYDDENPDFTVSTDEIGFFYKNTYVVWPLLASGATWDPGNLPESNLAIIYGDTGVPVASFEQISFGYDPYLDTGTHVDHHNITIIPLDEAAGTFRIVNGNDGGVYYSDDGGYTWLNTLNGYNTTQFYGVDKKPGADEYIGGMQDNGTWQSPVGENATAASDWLFRIGGDGYETSWHYEQPNKILGGSQFNGLQRSTDGGESWISIAHMVDNGQGDAPFVTKVGKTNSDPDLVFAVGVSGVWRSDNFGEVWTLASIPADQFAMTSMTQVKVSPVNPQVVWAGSKMNDPDFSQAVLQVSTDGGLTFAPTNWYTEVTLGSVTGMAVHPTDDQTAYALFSFSDAPKILRTTDLGESWEDISGFGCNPESDNGFPDVATYSLIVMPHDTDVIWAGTEVGLFESTDNGVSWHYADNGLPAVSIWQMNITDDQVVLATHGLGIWTLRIPELPPPPEVTRSPRLNRLVQGPDGFLKIDIDLRSPYDSTQVWLNNAVYTTLPANDDTQSVLVTQPVAEPMTVSSYLTAYKDGQTYRSPQFQTSVVPYQSPQTGYANNFDAGTDDFYGDGFSIATPAGFSTAAIHSEHPYQDEMNYTYLLQVPIVVDAADAFVSFDEIVIVEPGEPGTEFGDPQFWDYVIVEGTSTGLSWLPLLDGYDCRSDPAWLDAYDNAQSGDESLYRSRTIDLHETFAAGDTILIRFRLYSDALLHGWGWAIDDLEIQQTLGSGDQRASKPIEYRLSQNHPNPFKSNTTIAFGLPLADHVRLKVYDVVGREVATLIDGHLKAGNYEVAWAPGRLASGTYIYRLKTAQGERTRQMQLVR
jgi:photosystem II stability/assembly factor-like uncharacterized protein